jgi:AGZA family xanthine/uracil permease-like MFS transporter
VAVLTVIYVTLVAHHALPFKVPGALAALVLGVLLYYGLDALGSGVGVGLVPPRHALGSEQPWALPALLPLAPLDGAWWRDVAGQALAKLPVALPFALATVVGGIDCTESAAAAGDEYDTRAVLLTEGVASVAAAGLGGVIQTTPYIGHPAYKVMGGRAAYTLATALFVGAAGYFGLFGELFRWLPPVALFPILVFVGLEITAQSFRATPPRHYAALALAFLPTLAYLATIPLSAALGGRPPAGGRGEAVVLTLYCLANGFLVTSLLWAASLAAVLDGRYVRSACCLLVAAACALLGVIHSPFADAPLAWPWDVYARLPDRPEVRAQSPYHWAGAYVLAAALLLALGWFRRRADDKVTR